VSDKNFFCRLILVVMAGSFIGLFVHEGFHAIGGSEKALCVGNYVYGGEPHPAGMIAAFVLSNDAPGSVFGDELVAYGLTVLCVLVAIYVGSGLGIFSPEM